MATDWEAEGLLEGLEGEARTARAELLERLLEEGFTLNELRTAVAQGRLVLLPLERVLEDDGERRSPRAVAEDTGLQLGFLEEARRALGLPAVDPDEPVLGELERQLIGNGQRMLAVGLSEEAFLELTRTMSQAMATVASAFTIIFGDALLRPGDTEHDLGLRYAESMRSLGGLAGPTLEAMLTLRLRESIRQAVVGEAEMAEGHLPGGQDITVAFADMVGFTRLGEEIPADELGALVRRFEALVERIAKPPVRLVKTIGDAAMLMSRDPVPLLEASLTLAEAADEDDELPQLRAGVARGEAVTRAGDWYGRPVNLASRLTSFARRGSVVATEPVRDAAGDAFAYSFAGRRRFKGVDGEPAVYRVRRPT